MVSMGKEGLGGRGVSPEKSASHGSWRTQPLLNAAGVEGGKTVPTPAVWGCAVLTGETIPYFRALCITYVRR